LANSGTSDGDTVETFGALMALFHSETAIDDGVYNGFPEVDINTTWDIIVNYTPGRRDPVAFPRAYYQMAARRLASAVYTTTPSTLGFSDDILMSTSVGLFMRNRLTDIVPALRPEANIGSALDPRNLTIGTYRDLEYFDTTRLGFIRDDFTWTDVALPVQPGETTDNVVALRRDLSDDAINLPGYQITALRLDRDDLATQFSTPITININATVYAQDGSWFVMPMPLEDVSALATDDEKRQILRPNYQYVVQGNIAENFVPTTAATLGTNTTNPGTLVDDYPASTGINNAELDPDNNSGGAQVQWLNAASRPGNSMGTEWQTVRYAASAYEPSLTPDNMLYLPITPDIALQR
jgi:hypothetical protein